MKIFDGIRNPLVLLMSLIFCVTSSGCNTDYNTMLQEYNGCYEVKKTDKRIPEIGTESFSRYDMIPDEEYYVNISKGLILIAPKGGISYEWSMKKKDDENQKQLLSKRFSRSISLTVDGSIKIGVPYELVLKVSDNKKKNYEDSATIYFVEEDKEK